MALRLTEAQVGLLKVDTINSRTANTALYLTGGSTVYISSASNSSLIMRMGDREVARVSEKGNFIIGADDVTTTDYKLKVTGATGFAGGHIYLTGANASSSTGGTTQLVFGEPGNNHVVVSSNTKALVINPSTTTTTNQIVLYLDQHSLFPSGIKTTSTTNSTSATTGSIITSGGIGIGKNIFSTGRYTSNQAGARYIVNNNTLNGWFGFSENGESFGVYDVTNGYYLIKNTTKTTGGGVSLGSASQHTTVLGNLTVDKNTILSGTLTHTGQYFYQSGDATMKFYPQTNTDYGSESIAIQTCFDGQDGSSSTYVTSYENRCNLLLQPRGGQVYIGVNHTAIGDTANSLTVNGNAKITNLLTVGSGANHYGIKVGDTYINAISGNLIFQNNSAIRFGGDSWDYNVWAGLKYVHSSKTISLGLADGTTFTANAAQSGGTLALPGIRYFSVNGKRVLDAGDAWLRINEGNAFSTGIYFGTSLVRTDGQLQVGSSGSAFYAKSDGTGYFKSNLKVDGKLIMTGNIAYTNGGNQYDMIKFVTGDANGAGLVIGGGGVVVIGSGESASNFQGSSGANVAGSTETTYITSDNGIEFYTNCQTIGNRVGVILNTSRAFYPNANNTGSLGTTSYKWGSGYFYGAVNAGYVWASNQTGGEADIGVNFASGKNLYLYGNNSSGSRGLYDTNKGSVISVTDSTASFKGNADTASKWSSARTITHAGDLVGSYSLDGSKNVTDTSYLPYVTCARNNSNTTYAYHRIMHCSTTSSWVDNSALLFIHCGNQGGGFGIAKVSFRSNNIASQTGSLEISWLARSNLSANCLQGGFYWVANSSYADVYYHSTGTYSGTVIRVLQNARAGMSNGWTLVNSVATGSGASGTNTNNDEVYSGVNYRTYTATATGTDIGVVNTANVASKTAKTLSINGKTFNGSADTTVGTIGTAYGGTGNTSYTASRLIYSNSATKLASSNIAISGYNLTSTASDTTYVKYTVANTNGSVSLYAATNRGIYDNTGDGWLIYTSSTGTDAIIPKTLVLTKATDADATADKGPALIVGGARTAQHIEIDGNEIMSKSNGTTAATLYINSQGGGVSVGGQITGKTTSTSWIHMTRNGALHIAAPGTSSAASVVSAKTSSGSWGIGTLNGSNNLYFVWGSDTNYNNSTNTTAQAYIDSGGGVHGAVWNDYAEYRTTVNSIEPGRVVVENNDDTLSMSVGRLMPGANIVSDTFGFAIGETDEAKTPIAVSGRVLAYPFEPREEYCAGDPVCSGPNGTVSKMTREEVMMYPDRMIGTVSAIPSYETWGTGNIPVNGRIWIKVI